MSKHYFNYLNYLGAHVVQWNDPEQFGLTEAEADWRADAFEGIEFSCDDGGYVLHTKEQAAEAVRLLKLIPEEERLEHNCWGGGYDYDEIDEQMKREAAQWYSVDFLKKVKQVRDNLIRKTVLDTDGATS